jgi:hypothetical protein
LKGKTAFKIEVMAMMPQTQKSLAPLMRHVVEVKMTQQVILQ